MKPALAQEKKMNLDRIWKMDIAWEMFPFNGGNLDKFEPNIAFGITFPTIIQSQPIVEMKL